MGKAEWSVTVSDELNDAVMAYLAKSGQGVEALSNLVENAVGKYVQDPRALDKESDVTEGEHQRCRSAHQGKVFQPD